MTIVLYITKNKIWFTITAVKLMITVYDEGTLTIADINISYCSSASVDYLHTFDNDTLYLILGDNSAWCILPFSQSK